MKVLAVDTSSAVAAVAVVDGEKLLGEFLINHKKTHSQKLMPMLEQLLNSLELTPNDIDIFASAVGPGSFTGLRIGVAAIKGMAMAVGKPVAAVSALEAMAANLPYCKHLICPIMDARNSQVYCGVYRWGENGVEVVEKDNAMHLSVLLEKIKSIGEVVVFLGDGVPVYSKMIEDELGDKCYFAPASCNMQRASSVATIALDMAEKGMLTDAFGLLPEYLRKPQAEREREGKL